MKIQITIIGAGVVGLAIAAELSKTYKNLFIIEKNNRFGLETSSRNSEVIHAGIYYPPESLKSRLCLSGNHLLYDFCAQKRIPHRKCGKLIVACNADEAFALEKLRQNAFQTGVTDLEYLTSKKIKKISPYVKAAEALYSPSTGIIDAHRLMRKLLAVCQKQGVHIVYNARIARIDPAANQGYQIHVEYPDRKTDTFYTPIVINAAGLDADRVAETVGLDLDKNHYRLHYWKGEYFGVNAPFAFLDHLVYPVPLANTLGLGIHATIDLCGRVKLGPNAIYLHDKALDYHVEETHQPSFFDAAKRYLPFLTMDMLSPEMAGIRPKLQKPGDGFRDFIICEESEKGFSGLINLIGIESPGLTACLAIGKYVKALLKDLAAE